MTDKSCVLPYYGPTNLQTNVECNVNSRHHFPFRCTKFFHILPPFVSFASLDDFCARNIRNSSSIVSSRFNKIAGTSNCVQERLSNMFVAKIQVTEMGNLTIVKNERNEPKLALFAVIFVHCDWPTSLSINEKLYVENLK